jgi:hypothetical protein
VQTYGGLDCAVNNAGTEATGLIAIFDVLIARRRVRTLCDCPDERRPSMKGLRPGRKKPEPAEETKPSRLSRKKPAPAETTKPSRLSRKKPAPAETTKPSRLSRKKPDLRTGDEVTPR